MIMMDGLAHVAFERNAQNRRKTNTNAIKYFLVERTAKQTTSTTTTTTTAVTTRAVVEKREEEKKLCFLLKNVFS